MEPNEYFLRHIYEFGRKEGWQIERCGRVIPANWSGDGIISDYLELEDFAPVRNFERTPVVSRILSPRGKYPHCAWKHQTDRVPDRQLFYGQGFYPVCFDCAADSFGGY